MLSALEELMRLHPASRFGMERRPSDLEAFERLESRHYLRSNEHETERAEPTWMIGEVAAAAAMVVAFCGVLTVIARLAGDLSDPSRQPVVTASDAAPAPLTDAESAHSQ